MSFFPRRFAKRKAELDEEIQAHLQMDIQNRKDRGEFPEQARAAALREFGNIALIEDVTREAWGWVWLERLGQDLKYAFRQLRRSPVFTITVIATLTLGLGATAALFTVVDHVLLRPLPYEDSRQLVTISEAGKKGVTGGAPFLGLQQWHRRSHTLQEMAFYSATNHLSFLDGNTGSTRVNAPQISANLFSVLGVHPVMGRGFEGRSDGSVLAGESHNLILSDPVWRSTYGSDPDILGKAVKLNGESYIVVGVMPRGFTFPFGDGNAHVWLPKVIGDKDAVRVPNTTPTYGVVARLKPVGKISGEGLFNFTKNRRAVIIGVLDDERQVSIATESQPEIQICIPQITPDTLAYQTVEGLNMALAGRTDRSPSSIIPELRELMRQASPELSDSTFTTMDQIVEDSYGSQQLAARLLIVFGGSALLVCIAGTYGLLAYLVAHRTKELGLRIALGAQRGDVMWLVLRQASWMLIAGSSLGLILAYMTSLLLRTFLYDITAHDPWTMGAVTALLIGGGLAASYIPARRAAMVNPIDALRTE
jgi:hypothetical protein